MKVIFIKDHVGQGATVGTEADLPDAIANHLIRFGYANESRFQRLETVGETPKKNGAKQGGRNNGQDNEGGSEASIGKGD